MSKIKDVKLELSYIADNNVKWYINFKKKRKINMHQQYDPTFAATGTNPREQTTFLNTKIGSQQLNL